MSRTLYSCSAVFALVVLGIAAAAQEQPEFPGPETEHQWLEKFVGRWTTTAKASMGPDQPAIECTGTIHSRTIGDFWVVNEMQNSVQGVSMGGLQTIGYDPAKKKFVGTWVDSMTSHLWIYQGALDENGKKLTLEAEGPNLMADGKMAKYRDAYEFTSPDRIVMTSSMLDENGKWMTFMTGEARRSPPSQDASSRDD